MARAVRRVYARGMIKIHPFDTLDTLITRSREQLTTTLATRGNLMLSGGSTPYVIYNQLAADPCAVHPDRKLFLSDERMQPFDSDLNNAQNLAPMLDALACRDHFIRVDTTLSRAAAAEQFAAELNPLESVDLGLLGMGADGHTAGFFTTEQAAMKTGPLTLHTERPDGMEGVSVTPAFLKRVGRIILLVTGESKRAIIHTLLTAPETIAAGVALATHPHVELWTDLQLD